MQFNKCLCKSFFVKVSNYLNIWTFNIISKLVANVNALFWSKFGNEVDLFGQTVTFPNLVLLQYCS